jgi:hypothetical protein
MELLYPLLPPNRGVYLSNPNVILLLADERGLADVVFRNWSESDAQAISKFNKAASKYGFRISYKQDEAKAGNGAEVDGWVENLAGYEWVSENTKVPGILKYKASTGWQGLDAWKAKTLKELEACAVKGDYPKSYVTSKSDQIESWFNSASNMTAILNGVAFGYPDTAVMPSKSKGHYITSKIAYSDFYLGNEPNYLYYDDADFKDINAHAKRLGTLLGEYYHCQEHVKLANNPGFATARDVADNFGREVTK